MAKATGALFVSVPGVIRQIVVVENKIPEVLGGLGNQGFFSPHNADGAGGIVLVQGGVGQIRGYRQRVLQTGLGDDGHRDSRGHQVDLDEELIGLTVDFGIKSGAEAQRVSDV